MQARERKQLRKCTKVKQGLYWLEIKTTRAHLLARQIWRSRGSHQKIHRVSNILYCAANAICYIKQHHEPMPFHQFGIDIVGDLLKAQGKGIFLVVVVYYFTKWIEAGPMLTIIRRSMIKFMRNNIITRFGTHKTLISNKGLQFIENPFRGWFQERHIQQHFTSMAHLQANGQTKRFKKKNSGERNKEASGKRKRKLG